MNNLFSDIQHFFLVIITAVTVILPFHQPPPQSTPSPSSAIQVKMEATPSATSVNVLGVNKVENQTTNTSTPTTSGQSQQNTRNNQVSQPTVTHDGTRTGNITKYHEWCTGKDISVYENELLEKKGTDGKAYAMTQGDWDCYNRANSQPQQNQPGPVQNQQANNGQSITPNTSNNLVQPAFIVPPPSINVNNSQSSPQECSYVSKTVEAIRSMAESARNYAINGTKAGLLARGQDLNSAYSQNELAQAVAPVDANTNYNIALYCLHILSCPCP